MIDTVKIVISYKFKPLWVNTKLKARSNISSAPLLKITANPGKSYKCIGIYQPKLTYIERPTGQTKRIGYELAVEFSLPKLLNGNNFDEISNCDIPRVISKLSKVIKSTYGISVSESKLKSAQIRKIDFSKNIVFDDYTPISTIIGNVRRADVSKTYDVQNTNFRNGGHIYHIHTNSLDIAIYDKVADLVQERKSSKRSFEKDGYSQTELIDQLLPRRNVGIVRFEVRINSLRKIKSEMNSISFDGAFTLTELCTQKNSKKILIKHWNSIFEKIPKSLLDSETVEHCLINLMRSNQQLTMQEALAFIAYDQLAKDKDERSIRKLMEELFHPAQYRRFKRKSREPPDNSQVKSLMKITKEIEAMNPVSIDNYV